jgi:hypothetical protein
MPVMLKRPKNTEEKTLVSLLSVCVVTVTYETQITVATQLCATIFASHVTEKLEEMHLRTLS